MNDQMLNGQILNGMYEALELLQKGGPLAATGKIQETLLGLMPTAVWPGAAPADAPAKGAESAPAPAPAVIPDLGSLVPDLLARLAEVPAFGIPGSTPTAATDPAQAAGTGRFLSGSFTNQAGTRAYRLYVPSAWKGKGQGQALPLVVMLHGGHQTPDDCADGTGLNALAEDWPALVLYPAQSQSANATLCWNWFNTSEQEGDRGEPAIIAGMTREVMADYGVDPRRVYCAGMSAGAAMAVILGATHPDLFAAIGTHSGMPYAAASDFTSAFAAMNGNGPTPPPERLHGVPVIAFHGDRDATVHHKNSDRILVQALPVQTLVETLYDRAETGHAYTRTIHRTPEGRVLAEQWLIHGCGHAWSGGGRRGSFTDPRGPDAAREMLRFFAAQTQAAS